MAKVFKISRSSLSLYKESQEFSDIIKKGKAIADSEVERSLFERANGYTHRETKVFCSNGDIVTEDIERHYPPDAVACMFWLCNRKKGDWQHIQKIEHSGKDGKAIEVAWLKPE